MRTCPRCWVHREAVQERRAEVRDVAVARLGQVGHGDHEPFFEHVGDGVFLWGAVGVSMGEPVVWEAR